MYAQLTETGGLLMKIAPYIIGGLIVVALGIPIVLFLKRRYQRQGDNVVTGNLQNEKNKSDIIINAIADGVVLIDQQGIIQAFNPGASLISGWPQNEALNLDQRSVFSFVDAKGESLDETSSPFARILKEHETIKDNTAILKTRAGKTIDVSLVVSPLFDANKEFVGAVGVFRDVTAERTQEKQRAEFISTASHEMRTPVAAIEGYLALALNDKVSQIDMKARSYLEKAHSSTQALGKLFQDLLTSAKAEDGRLVSHPVVVEMGSYMEQLAEGLRFAAEKKGLLVNFTLGSEGGMNPAIGGGKVVKPLYYTSVDPDRMREVVTNLFDNAVKYTESGKITIGLTGNTEVVQLSINDTGPGIPAEDIPHLFQKFYRVDSSATRTIGGTGLGLFICRKIVELYKGRIWVESEVGKGSTFYINLPRLSTQKASEQQQTEAANPAILSNVSSSLDPTPAPVTNMGVSHDTISTSISS